MNISKDKIEHMAHLAKINLLPEEKEKFFKEFSQILDFIEKLQEADTSKIEPFASGEIAGVSREDSAIPKSDELIRKLINNVPEKEENLVKTKKIF